MPETLCQLLTQWNNEQDSFSTKLPDQFKHQLRMIKVYTIQGEKWVIGLQYKEWTIHAGTTLADGYIVFTMDNQQYPNEADAILHVSAMQSLK